MIVHRHAHGELFDQQALAVENEVSIRTVRRRCRHLQVASDLRSRAPLYDPDTAAAALAGVRPRAARNATQRPSVLTRAAISTG